MKIFIAGASGTIGRPVVRELVKRGHEVVGLTRFDKNRRLLFDLGATPVMGDALDAAGLQRTVRDARPDQVVHLLTALPQSGAAFRPRHLEPTNRLRRTGTANLIAAALDAGARRIVAESFVAVYGSTSGRTSERDPLPPVPSGPFRRTVQALRSLEEQLGALRAAGRMEAVSLRIGFLYGPHVPMTRTMMDQARAGRLFMPRNLQGIGAFVHLDDAVESVVAAIEHRSPGPVYNVVDDEPMPTDQFALLLTRALGAAPPRHVPFWLVKLAAPIVASLLNAQFDLTNFAARSDLGWRPRHRNAWLGLQAIAGTLGVAA